MIFAYVIRSLLVRARSTLVALLVIGATTGAIAIVLGVANGLQAAIEGQNKPDLAVIIAKGATADNESNLPFEALQRIEVSPGIASMNGKPMISAELVDGFPIRRANGEIDNLHVRGVDPIALAVHPEVRLASGTMPQPGTRDIVVGRRLLNQYQNMVEGGTIRIGRSKWTITGTLTGPGGAAESEVWCDRTSLQAEQRTNRSSLAYVKLESPDRISELRSTLEKMHDQNLEAISAQDLRRRSFAQAAVYVKAIMVVIIALCISAVFAGTSATYSMFLGQMRELGTLMAIGFTRRRVASLVLAQSLILTFVGAALGLGVAALANGHSIVFYEAMLIYDVKITPEIFALGAFAALTVGIAGSVMAMIQTYQLNILAVVRE